MNNQVTKQAMSLKEQIIETTLRKNVINTVSRKSTIFKLIQNDLIPFAKIDIDSIDQTKTEDNVKMTFGELGSVEFKFVWEIMHSFDMTGKTTIKEPKIFFDGLSKMLPSSVELGVFESYTGNVTVTMDTAYMGRIHMTINPDGDIKGHISASRDIKDGFEKMLSIEELPISTAEFEDNRLHVVFNNGEELDMNISESGTPITKVKNIL